MRKLITIILVLFSINCDYYASDTGLKIINWAGHEYKPKTFPVKVYAPQENMEMRVLDSIEWWNGELYYNWLIYCDRHDDIICNEFPTFIEYSGEGFVVDIIEVSSLEAGTLGNADTDTSLFGFITYSHINILDRVRTHYVLDHEIGHGVFGLAHDVSIGYLTTIDGYDSVMLPSISNNPDTRGVTYEDAVSIFEDYKKAMFSGRVR